MTDTVIVSFDYNCYYCITKARMQAQVIVFVTQCNCPIDSGNVKQDPMQ